MVKPKVAFRADGNSRIGLGHIHRSLALAEIVSNAFDFTLFIREPSDGTYELVRALGGNVYPLPEHSLLTEAEHLVPILNSFDIVVLDGYEFDTAYQHMIRLSGARLVCIDDIHQHHFVADVVINHAGNAQPQWYSKELTTRLCLGIPYLLVKKPFREIAKTRPAVNRTDEVFVSIGGADVHNDTLLVLNRIEQVTPGLTVHVVTGEAYRHHDALRQFCTNSKVGVTLHSNLSPAGMLALMKHCSVAVCAPSGVAYEYLCVGGELYVHQTADNQADLRRFLLDAGLALSFSDFRVSNRSQITWMLSRQQQVFDGQSDIRLQEVFKALSWQHRLTIRKVRSGDLNLLFQWANDSLTRRLAFNSQSISLEDHTVWFNKKMNDANAYLYIFEIGKIPVGQIRFDVNEQATITYAVDQHYRGMGLGAEIVKKGIQAFRNDSGFTGVIEAYVKKDNESSKKVFDKLGFRLTTSDKPAAVKYIVNYE